MLNKEIKANDCPKEDNSLSYALSESRSPKSCFQINVKLIFFSCDNQKLQTAFKHKTFSNNGKLFLCLKILSHDSDNWADVCIFGTVCHQYRCFRFIGEEDSAAKNRIAELTDDPTWIIDPIDGTANFVRGLPITCISVGFAVKKQVVMGVVFNPYMDELYYSIKGEGAYLNGTRLQTSGLEGTKVT